MALAADVAQLIVSLRLDDKGFSGKLNAAAGQLKAMDSGLSQMGRGLGQVSGGLLRLGERAAIGAAAGLGAVVTTAASFEQAFTGVEKTVEGTDAQLAELEETIRGMARSMPVSFEELASIGEAGGALGVARDSLDEFIDVVARLAVSTDLSSDQAATALGQLGTILHLEGAEFEDFADSLVALGNAGASTESQIVDVAARFAAAGNSAGLSKEEILALASSVASMGIEVEAGGTSLSRLFNNTTTNIALAKKPAKEFAEALGMTFEDFKRSWDTDALGTFQQLLAHLNTLDKFAQAELLKGLGITNTRDIAAIGLMAQNVGFVGEQLKVAETATGALDKESDKFFDTAVGQWKTFINIVRDAAAIIGTEVLPVTKEVLTSLSESLNNPEMRTNLKTFGKDLAEGIRGLITELKGTDFSGIIGGLKLTAEVAKGAFDAFRSLPQPIQQLAIAALVANKVSGGAIGQIAKGLGNLVLGSLKTVMATNVTVIGRNVTGGGGIGGPLAAGGKGGGMLAGAGRLIGGAFAVAAAAAMADEFKDEIQGLGAATSRALFPGGAPLAGLGDWLGNLQWPFGPEGAPDWARFDTPAKELFTPGDKGGRTGAGSVGGSFADDIAALDLASNEVIERLRGTTEIGLKGVGTSFQVGLKTGLDPVGDTATRILARAENPKDPPVMLEIQGHIAGLEEIQRTYLAQGDVRLATKVQANIDTLHSLIGTTDQSNALLGVISRKDFSPRITVPVSVFSTVSIHDVARTTASARGAYAGATIL